MYLGLGNSYGFTNIFKIWDLKEQADASGVSLSQTFGIDDNSHFTISGNSFTTKKATEETMTFTNKLHEIGNVQFTMNVGENIHKLTYNVYFTPKYYAISYPSTYNANYGVVVDGNASTTSSTTFTDWKNNFKLLDYYGNEVGSNSSLSSDGITLENFQGTGNVSGTTISGLSADSPITIAVKSNNVQIGTVLVTMRRYYALTGGATANENYTNTNTLDFDVWANGIKAFVVGGTASESIPRGLSHFDFIAPSGYSVIYTGGEYKLRKLSGNFTAGDIQIAVKYLGKELGTIKVTISSSNVVASVVTS